MLSQIETLPLFTGSLGLASSPSSSTTQSRGGLQEGDVLVVNDPFLTGTHQWDVAVIVPGFLDGEIVSYAAIKAHHLDVGALAPFVTREHRRLPGGHDLPGRQALAGGRPRRRPVPDVRSPTRRLPDPRPATSAHRRAPAGPACAACSSSSSATALEQFEAAVEVILDAGEAQMREKLAEFPPGRYTAPWSTSTTASKQVMLPYEVAVEFDDDGITIDLTDAPDPQPGPVNAPQIGVDLGDPLRDDGARRSTTARAPTRATSGRCS